MEGLPELVALGVDAHRLIGHLRRGEPGARKPALPGASGALTVGADGVDRSGQPVVTVGDQVRARAGPGADPCGGNAGGRR
ncbi:MAG: hypothetical protein U5L11_10085 [Arhodomonas sp.]|nr:hypothetical protein [Arhodomonas sp.]